MTEALIYILIELAQELVEAGVEYVIRHTIDDAGNKIVEFVQEIDHDNNGVVDEEIVIHSIEAVVPDVNAQYNLVSDGDTVGIGMPYVDVIDGLDFNSYVDFSDPFNMPELTVSGGGYLLDMDSDGDNDDVVIMLPDFNGDGVPEFGWIVDADDNGLPDVSPDSPYYPVGSEGYYDIVNNITSENNIMTKELNDYTVTEGLLFLMLFLMVCYFIKSLFKKKDIYR